MTEHRCDYRGTPCLSEGRRYLTGWRCLSHSPAGLRGETVPTPVLPARSAVSPAPVYGTATDDPLGREGPGWHQGKATRLPTRDKKIR